MLGSLSEADDAVQDAWTRYQRTDTSDVVNLGGWLTTVTARVCLGMLRVRGVRREEPLEVHVPDPIVSPVDDPEQEVLLADAVGLALQVVLETLSPPERLAFVLHDLFAVPFDEIAPMVGKTTTATRQLASRARRRVRAAPTSPDADLAEQRAAVDAFFAAARDGDLPALVAVLHPDVELRADAGEDRDGTVLVRGAETVAGRAMMFAGLARFVRPALVNGAAGVVVVTDGGPVSVMAFTVRDGAITRIDVVADPDRLATYDLDGFS